MKGVLTACDVHKYADGHTCTALERKGKRFRNILCVAFDDPLPVCHGYEFDSICCGLGCKFKGRFTADEMVGRQRGIDDPQEGQRRRQSPC